ncbi:hypothetical protein VNO80_14278 [Phaseolus coccineus]|uniref:Uncharacterized protein n=1 Tax=Phaseolus coccineus TaxID=3886 RepID=A0AAN9MMU4_PHACN
MHTQAQDTITVVPVLPFVLQGFCSKIIQTWSYCLGAISWQYEEFDSRIPMKWPIRQRPFDFITRQWILLLLFVPYGVHILSNYEAYLKHSPFLMGCMPLRTLTDS